MVLPFSEHVTSASEKRTGCVAKTRIRSKESVTPSTNIPNVKCNQFARVNNGFVVKIPSSILKRRSHITTPYGDLLRVVLSNALTYVTDLQDIMRAEIALRFPLSPFDSRPAYMKYVRCGKLMRKELETRTLARCLPSISRRAWKHALAIASATRESLDYPIHFHPQELGLDYDEYDREHPRDFLARSLMVLANHPKTKSILLRIAGEFAADQYDSNAPRNVVTQERGYSSDVDDSDAADAGIGVTRGKNPRPYEIEKRNQVVCDLRQIVQNLAGKLQECAKGVGCVQFGSAEMSKIVDHLGITDPGLNNNNLWNVTMQVTALQTDAGPVNYTTSYISTSPSAQKNSPNWESNLTEMDDSIFGPNLAADASPQSGWGFMPHIKNQKYHLVNPDELLQPGKITKHPSDSTGLVETLFASCDASLDASEKQTNSFHGFANGKKQMDTETEKRMFNIGSCDGHRDGLSVCQERSSKREKKTPSTVKADGHSTVQYEDEPTVSSDGTESEDSGMVPAISLKAIRLREYFTKLFEEQPTRDEGKNTAQTTSGNSNCTPQNLDKLEVDIPSDEAELEDLPEQVQKIHFNNARHRAMFRFLQGKSASKSLLIMGASVTGNKSLEVLTNEVSHGRKSRVRHLAQKCYGSGSLNSNKLRGRKPSVWKVADKSRNVTLDTKEFPDIQLHESKACRSKIGGSFAQNCRTLDISYPAVVGNWLVKQVAAHSKIEDDRSAVLHPASNCVQQKTKRSTASTTDSDLHQPAKDLPTVCDNQVPEPSNLSSTTAAPTNGAKKRSKSSSRKRAKRKAKRLAASRLEIDDHQMTKSNPNHACSNATADILPHIPSPPKPLPKGSKKTHLRKSERPSFNKSNHPENSRYHPFERRHSPKKDTLGSLPVSVYNPMKTKHTYHPNPLVVAKWKEVIEQVTGKA